MATPVTFGKMEDLKFGDKFVTDMDFIDEKDEHLMFLSWKYDGVAMVSCGNTNFVRGFESGLRKEDFAIKLSH